MMGSELLYESESNRLMLPMPAQNYTVQ